jgi:hypothetical protein
MSAKRETYPRRNPTTAHRSVADEGYLVVVPSRAEVKVLNPVGGKIFSLLDGKHSEEDIVRALVEEFEVGEDEARRDLAAFLDELREKDMLARAEDGGHTTGAAADE